MHVSSIKFAKRNIYVHYCNDTSYRPVTFLSVREMTLTYIHQSITNSIPNTTLQLQYLTQYSTATTLHNTNKALDTGKIVVGVYLHIRKAIDSISHFILLDKLYKIGILCIVFYKVILCLVDNLFLIMVVILAPSKLNMVCHKALS